MREMMLAVALLGLASCSPAVPDSAAGVGFGDYKTYQQRREAELIAGATGPGSATGSGTFSAPSSVSAQPLSAISSLPAGAQTTQAGVSEGDSAASLAADTQAALGLSTASQEPLQASPSNPAPEAVNALGISQENNFEAVGEQRSIAEDKEFIAENRQRYEQVQPEALPERSSTGPNLAAYALQAKQSVGTPLYSRMGLNAENRYVKNCAKYASPDLAQADFLSNGGPERDRMGLDPDGDGFACTWDPAPFRKAALGSSE